MPFRSEAQRRFMWKNHEDIARRWSKEYGAKVVKSRRGKKSKKAKGKS